MTEAEALVRARTSLLSIARALAEACDSRPELREAVVWNAMLEAQRTFADTAGAGDRAQVIAAAQRELDSVYGRQS